MASGLRKQRRSFTLSPQSIAYLEIEKRRRQADSTSAVLDDILRERLKEKEREKIGASIAAYYDSLSDDQVAENQQWARLSESQFPLE